MNKKLWTLRYAIINITYFAAFCGVHAYAAVYLLDKGFTNTQVGILLAVANVLSVVLQPIVAGFVDKPGRLSNRIVVMIATLLMIAGCGLLYAVGSNFAAVFIIYALIYMVQMGYQPMMIAMNFEYQKAGCRINFGLARGLGSAGFAVTSAFMGNAVKNFGVNVILVVNIAVLTISFIMVWFFKEPRFGALESTGENISDRDCADTKTKNAVAHNNIIEFVKYYPSFTVMLIGVAFLFFAHNAINDFLIQIVRDMGGNETQMGYANFLQAILELPMMAMAASIIRKTGTKFLLSFSAVFFTLKVLIMFASKGLVGMFISQSFQFFAYAVLIPTAAIYVTEKLEELDQVKGQALINCAITVGGVFSNLTCGKILDVYDVKRMLLIGLIVSIVGTVLVVCALYSKGKANR